MSNPYFTRGGHQIILNKEPRYFTTVVNDEAAVHRVRSIGGVQNMKKIHGRFFKVEVDPDKRDEAMDFIRSTAMKGICHHAYHPVNDPSTRFYITDRVILRFKEGTSLAEKERVLAQHGLRFSKKLGDPHTYLLNVTKSTGKNPIKCCNDLTEHDSVEYAEPNLINRFKTQTLPDDDLFQEQWHLKSSEDIHLAMGADVDAEGAWEITKGSRDVVVAIIDDGFDLSHPDLMGPDKIVAPKDFIDGDNSPFPEADFGDYHGTPCAGVAIGEENGRGIVGIAPQCAWTPIRFNLAAEDHELWEIFDYASQHADVISCSWGPVPVFAPLSQLLKDKFTEISRRGGRRGKGALILFSAGNYNAPLNAPDNTDFDWYIPEYGVQKTTGPILNGNAVHPDIMAIAASTSLNSKAAYSNWGAEISVAAPSSNFHPIDDQVWLPGRSVWSTDNDQTGADFTPNSRYTGDFGGTSSAAPLVAGIAALVISANPDLTASQVKSIIEETADPIEDDQADPVLGHNKGSYNAEGHSEWFGFGKANAAKAVRRALEVAGEDPEDKDISADLQEFVGRIVEDGGEERFAFEMSGDFHVTLEGPSEMDFDLYLKKDGPPTATNYDFKSTDLGSDEFLRISASETTKYEILVKSYRGTGPFKVIVDGT